jgi:hypothetical protein
MTSVRSLTMLCLILVLSGCDDPLSSLCENRVINAQQDSSRGGYISGHKAGVKAALECIYSEGGKLEKAVEICRTKIP